MCPALLRCWSSWLYMAVSKLIRLETAAAVGVACGTPQQKVNIRLLFRGTVWTKAKQFAAQKIDACFCHETWPNGVKTTYT